MGEPMVFIRRGQVHDPCLCISQRRWHDRGTRHPRNPTNGRKKASGATEESGAKKTRTAARNPWPVGGTPVVAGVQPPGFAPVTEEVLQAIVHRLVTGLHPHKIILFGSYVYGTPTADSDVDLLVILDTQARPVDRYLRVSRLLRPRPFPLDLLVKTPEEIVQALERRTPSCARSSRKGGCCMSEPTDPLAWVHRAEEDWLLARSALRRKVPLIYGATFHAQQCAEKYLKALLVSRRQAFPRTHDVVALHDLCRRHGLRIPVDPDQLERLTAYAVQVRYPGEDPTPDEAREAVQIAQEVRRWARAVLLPSSRQS